MIIRKSQRKGSSVRTRQRIKSQVEEASQYSVGISPKNNKESVVRRRLF